MSPKRPSRVLWWVLGAALVVAWVVMAGRMAPRGAGDLPKPTLQGFGEAAYAWSLRDENGKPVDFGGYRGKVVFLNVWATWCGPCREELPAIANLARNPRLKGVAFLCVAGDEPAAVRRFRAGPGKGMPMTFLVADGLPAPFATDAIPATFVITHDGRIVVAQVGAAQWDDPDVVDRLAKLLERKESNRR
ncbi:MAG TPA: TlpA disulfide reductase family protein [Isosphaeraceae bacterium]|jgi:thiol-disulfide isomerase/thioredoxin|nr:TlpA disulfide reductase family protein [Isosphaeraceae bacterium]